MTAHELENHNNISTTDSWGKNITNKMKHKMSQKAVTSTVLRSEIERKTRQTELKQTTSWNIWKGQQNSPPYGTSHPKMTIHLIHHTRGFVQVAQNYLHTLDPATSTKRASSLPTSQKKHRPHICRELLAEMPTQHSSRVTQSRQARFRAGSVRSIFKIGA